MDFSGLIASYRPPSAVEEDVLECLHRPTTSKQPLRRLADDIIRRKSPEAIRESLDDGDLYHRLDEPVKKGLRLLHYAAYQDEPETMLLLLEFGAYPNVMDETGYTPLHICAEKGYMHLIEVLISYGARIKFTEVHPSDQAFGQPPRATPAEEPLRLAIRAQEHATAQMLLEHGADPSAAYYLGQEVNMVDMADFRSLELLLVFGADPNARDLQGLTPLMKACRNAQAVEACHLLISYGADVNATSVDDHKSPLHYAVLTGNLEIAQILVRNGAQVCFPHELTRPPPLYYAVLRGSLGILDFLLDSGADVNAPSTVVGSALHLALTEKVDNQLEVVRTLLARGANPNAITTTDDDRPVLKTPIGEYLQNCEHPRLDVIQLFLKYGARIVLKCQRDHNFGILKVIHRIHLGLSPEVFFLLLDASESFDVSFIEKSRQMSEDMKMLLCEKALQPFSLLQASRIQLRKSLGWGPSFVSVVQNLCLPPFLKRYILFEED